MSRAGQRPAELATATARAASLGGPAVAFSIVHWSGEQAPPVIVRDAAGQAWNQSGRQALAFDLPSLGFRIFTSVADAPASTLAGLGDMSTRPGSAGRTYDGIASLNPRFLYESARDHEFLLSAGSRPWAPDIADSLVFGRVMAELAAVAANRAKAPILIMQSPAAPFPAPPADQPLSTHSDWPTIAGGAAIRLSVGLSGDDGKARLQLLEHATRVAEDYGLRLHLGDRRLGRVRGEWWPGLEHDPDKYDRMRALPGVDGTAVPDRALLLTFVGPARVGSSADILRALVERRIGVLAMTVSALQDLAFVNLVVPMRPGAVGVPPWRSLILPPGDGLDLITHWCAVGPPMIGPRSPLGRASDYGLCLTGPVPPRAEAPARPLWLRWQKPTGKDVSSNRLIGDVIARLLEDDQVKQVRLDYFRSRVVGDSRRMTAKLSVRMAEGISEPGLGPVLGTLARSTQADIEWALSGRAPAARSTRLMIAWRERWLGRIGSSGVS